MTVSLVWATPNADQIIGDLARVSAPENQGKDATKLIASLIRRKEWLPLEMADMCVEIYAERDVTRQILRHGKTFRFQEFSQRYSAVDKLPPAPLRAARMRHPTDRQASVPCEDQGTAAWWLEAQEFVQYTVGDVYSQALQKGIAKEVARSVLPEGLTMSRMYMKGDIRGWLFFCQLRMGNGTQPETQTVARGCWDILRQVAPATVAAFESTWSEPENAPPAKTDGASMGVLT